MGLDWQAKEGHLFADSDTGQYWITSGHFFGLHVFSINGRGVQLDRLGTFHDMDTAKASANKINTRNTAHLELYEEITTDNPALNGPGCRRDK